MSVDIAQLPITIQKAWNATVPPIVELCIFALLVTWPLDFSGLVGVVPITIDSARLLPPENIQEVLKFYNLASLAPIAVVIAVLFLAQSVGSILRYIGHFTPPFILYSTTGQLYSVLDPWLLRKLWVCHPELEYLNGLNAIHNIINDALDKASNDQQAYYSLRNLAKSNDRVSIVSERIDFTKGLITVLLFLWIFLPILTPAVRIDGPKVLFEVLLLIVILTALLREYILADYQKTRMKVSAYLDYKALSLPNGGEPDRSNEERDKKRIEELESFADLKQVYTFHLLPIRIKNKANNQLVGAFLVPIGQTLKQIKLSMLRGRVLWSKFRRR